MNDPRVKKLKQLTGTMKTARAEMAAGQGSLACLTGVVLAVYSQVDDMRDRWEAEDKRAFRLFDEAMKQQGQASIEDYDGVAGKFSFDESGDIWASFNLQIIKEGKFLPYDN